MGLFNRFFKKTEQEDQDQAPPDILPLRNDLCWCDSGLKYKKCHMDKDHVYLEKQQQKTLTARKACSPVFG